MLESYVDRSILESLEYENEEYKTKIDFKKLHKAIKLLKNSKKPLILAGAGTVWSQASDTLTKFAEENEIPVVTTYPARGVVSEESSIALGMIGLRGTEAANYAGKNCDVLIALGCKFSERTLLGIGDGKIIHINIDESVLTGDVKIQGDVKEFLDRIMDIKFKKSENWHSIINKFSTKHHINTNIETSL